MRNSNRPQTNTAFYQRGFTLVEVLVYIAILVLVCVASVTLILKLSELLDLYRADQMVTKSAQTAAERMLYEIRDAELVDALDPSSILDASPGHLVIDDGSGNITEFYLSSSTLMVSVNNVEEGPLTSSGVSVDSLQFNHYDNGRTETVRVSFTLTATAGRSSTTESFNTAAVLKGSYD